MTPKSNNLGIKRNQAKVGMAVSLGVLVATSLLNKPGETGLNLNRTIHICAGFAMVGFSLWHWSLYQKTSPGRGFRRMSSGGF